MILLQLGSVIFSEIEICLYRNVWNQRYFWSTHITDMILNSFVQPYEIIVFNILRNRNNDTN